MIKKIISLMLTLSVIFNSAIFVFAGKGDPLLEHPEYGNLIRKEFDKMWTSYQNPEFALKWEQGPDFTLGCFSNDYRTTRVYNIPHLLTYKPGNDVNSNGFLLTYMKALINARKVREQSKKLEHATKEEVVKYFSKEIKKIFKENGLDKGFAEFLGTTDETATEAFILSIIMAANSKILGAAVGASCVALNVFNFLQLAELTTIAVAPPIGIAITIIHNLVNVARIFTTKSALEQERVANNALVLCLVYNMLLNDQENILNSNVLVTAVDERPFYSAFIWNSFPGRENHGAWAQFTNIRNLKCSPVCRDYRNGELITIYTRLFRDIMQNESLDLNLIEKMINDQSLTNPFYIPEK